MGSKTLDKSKSLIRTIRIHFNNFMKLNEVKVQVWKDEGKELKSKDKVVEYLLEVWQEWRSLKGFKN